MKNKLIIMILFLLIIIINSSAKKPASIILGILETHRSDWPCKNISPQDNYYSFIRLTFIYTSNKWLPIDIIKNDKKILNMENNSFKPIDGFNYDDIYTKYYLLFDMKNIGTVNAIKSNEYPDENSWRSVISIKDQNIVRIGKPSNIYSEDWCSEISYRPIIVSNVPNYHDPMHWKPNKNIDRDLILKCEIEFNKFLERELTKEAFDPEPVPTGKIEFSQSFISSKSDLLVQLTLIPNKRLLYNGNLLKKWFFVSKDKIEYLGSYKSLIDAADYDCDGSSDLIFFETGGYNSSGYTLIYNNLKSKSIFYYGHH